jgi:hypothetical protein
VRPEEYVEAFAHYLNDDGPYPWPNGLSYDARRGLEAAALNRAFELDEEGT